MAVTFAWSTLWAEFKRMPDEMKEEVGRSLDAGEEGGFEDWLRSRSPKAQVDVLDNAPEQLQKYMYDQNVLTPYAAFAMDIQSPTIVRDRRINRNGY